MISVHLKFKLKEETLFLAINIIDRFLSQQTITKDKFQLIATTALFIATKYEEIYPPTGQELLTVSKQSYTYN
jgi:hypothetical protein